MGLIQHLHFYLVQSGAYIFRIFSLRHTAAPTTHDFNLVEILAFRVCLGEMSQAISTSRTAFQNRTGKLDLKHGDLVIHLTDNVNHSTLIVQCFEVG